MLGNEDKILGEYDKKFRRGGTCLNQVRSCVMSIPITAKELFREAFPIRRYGKLDNLFYHAVRFIGPRVQKPFTVRRARSLWEGTARRIDSDEMDAIRAALMEERLREQQDLKRQLVLLDAKIAAFTPASDRKAMAGKSPENDQLR